VVETTQIRIMAWVLAVMKCRVLQPVLVHLVGQMGTDIAVKLFWN
jgi:hypothetical protein